MRKSCMIKQHCADLSKRDTQLSKTALTIRKMWMKFQCFCDCIRDPMVPQLRPLCRRESSGEGGPHPTGDFPFLLSNLEIPVFRIHPAAPKHIISGHKTAFEAPPGEIDLQFAGVLAGEDKGGRGSQGAGVFIFILHRI